MFLYCLVFLFFLAQADVARADPVVDQVADPIVELSDHDAVRFWLEGFRKEALAAGVSGDFFDRVFADFEPLQKVILAANNQPEFVKLPEDYVDLLVSQFRIHEGRARLAEHIDLLESLERVYGVDRHILAAIWGVESNYGANVGGYRVVQALATLAIDGDRARFAHQQLLALLPILEKENLSIDVSGSWAGAMGQMQFIPTTYADYAIDHDQDGKRDIWHNVADSLGSAANYLKRSGWVAGLFWGVEVHLPEDFDIDQYDESTTRSLQAWRDAGYRLATGEDIRMRIWQTQEARLFLPKRISKKVSKEIKGPAFLVTRNFDVLLKYNSSSIYAIAVGHLSDRLRGALPFVVAWHGQPKQRKHQLTRDEVRTAQRLLKQLGFDAGPADGLVGEKTGGALRLWQSSAGLEEDGLLTLLMLDKISAAALSLSREEIKLLQERLAGLGFDPGLADGLMGRRTRSALRRWQEESGLPVDGHPDRDILAALTTTQE